MPEVTSGGGSFAEASAPLAASFRRSGFAWPIAVTRIAPDTRDLEPLLPHEAIDLPTALATFTAGSAYANFLEGETGTVEPAKLADLAVLDRDVLDPGSGPIGDARVLLTLVEGEAVYADPGLGW